MARTSLVLGSIFMLIYFVISTILNFIFLFYYSNLLNIIGQITFFPAIIGGILLFLGFKVGMGRIGILLTLLGDITGILSYTNSPFNVLMFYLFSSVFLTSIGLILLGMAFYLKGSKGSGTLLVAGSAISIPFGVVYLLSLYMNFNIPVFNYGNSSSSIFLAYTIYDFFVFILPSFSSAIGFGLILLREKRMLP